MSCTNNYLPNRCLSNLYTLSHTLYTGPWNTIYSVHLIPMFLLHVTTLSYHSKPTNFFPLTMCLTQTCATLQHTQDATIKTFSTQYSIFQIYIICHHTTIHMVLCSRMYINTFYGGTYTKDIHTVIYKHLTLNTDNCCNRAINWACAILTRYKPSNCNTTLIFYNTDYHTTLLSVPCCIDFTFLA